ncbi:MAG TPA: hypothetical protein ENK66_03040 [Arcobacter sp.]|nr:hypothetical protein [Arcobacter sp.]
MNKLVVYCDDAPFKEELLAAGLNRVNTRMFKAVNDNIESVCISHEGIYFTKDDIAIEFIDKSVFMNLNSVLVKILKKTTLFFENYFHLYIDFLFYLFLPKVLHTIKKSDCSYIFIPVGANIRALKRAVKISEKSSLPLAVFIGDEFKNYARLSGNKESIIMCDKYLQQWLSKISKIFVISEGMQNYFLEEYNLKSTVLNIPYEKKYSINSDKRKDFILFLGNTSHFYQDGLVDMIEVLFDYNQKYNKNIVLRFTIDKIPDIFEEKYLQYIEYGKIDTDYNSSKILNEALFCFIPTSFDKKYKIMVGTSFPSKMMECLAFAKHIVVYGPQYSSSVRYFKKYNLDTVVSQRNKEELFKILTKKDLNYSNQSKVYNYILNQNHSLKNIKDTIMKEINK